VPPGLDDRINRFLTAGGAGTGNLTDYYSDVSYGAIQMANKVYGWYPAPFDETEPGLMGQANRYKRVQQCASVIPPSDMANIDFGSVWGIIMVINHPQDDGACDNGQIQLTIQGTPYPLACVILNNFNLDTAYGAHEVGHGLGMPHSYDNTQNLCGSSTPGQYCDSWDIMSGAGNTYQFWWSNYPPPPNSSGPGSGPGTNVPNLLFLNAIPSTRIATYQIGSSSQSFSVRALSHPIGFDPLAVRIVGGNPYATYTVEYRQADGWDAGLPVNAVLIHEYKVGASPYSYLQSNSTLHPGAWVANTIFLGPGNQFQVTVNSINTSSGAALITIAP